MKLFLLVVLGLALGEEQCCVKRGRYYNLEYTCSDSSTQFSLTKNGADYVYSSQSISSLLENVYLGSDGELKIELEKALHIKDGVLEDVPEEMLSVYNAIVIDQTCCSPSEHFLQRMSQRNVKLVRTQLSKNYEAVRKELNDDVARVTDGNIQDILPEGVLSPATTLVVVNAVHFVGEWKYGFDKKRTMKRVFHQSPTQSTLVDMMNVPSAYVVHRQLGELELVSVPYKAENLHFAMVFSRNSDVTKISGLELNDLVKGLDAQDMTAWLASSHFKGRVKANLSMPKFRIESEFDLKEHFIKNSRFRNLLFPSLDLPGILGQSVHHGVDYFTHRAVIDVDEKGTVASAATAFASSRSAFIHRPVYLVIDQPFLFYVFDSCRARYLFSGSYNGGKEQEDPVFIPS